MEGGENSTGNGRDVEYFSQADTFSIFKYFAVLLECNELKRDITAFY